MKQFLFLALFALCSTNVQLQAQPDGFPFGMGIPDDPDQLYAQMPTKAPLVEENYRSVGTRASLEKYAPTPRSQGLYGTCTSWAAGYCGRTILEAQRYGWTNQATIDANAFSQGFAYQISSYKEDCNGAYISKCLKKMQEIGIVKQAIYPEDCPQTTISKSLYQQAATHRIKGAAALWNRYYPATPKQKVQLLKKSLSEGHPVVIAMYIPLSFCYSKGDVWTRRRTDIASGNQGHQHNRHAMCLIGYDDEKYGGAFRIQNSWGTNWADKGYIWVKYEDAAEFIYQAMEMFKLPAVTPDKEETKLAGALQFIENTGKKMQAAWDGKGYQFNKAYQSGTRFKIYLQNQHPAYVYALSSDLNNNVQLVFPDALNISPLLNYSSNTVPIPSKKEHIRLDGTTGTDFLCILYSKEPLNIFQIKLALAQENNRYSFQEKVQRVLQDVLIPAHKIQYAGSEIQFSTHSKDKTVAAIFLQWQHID